MSKIDRYFDAVASILATGTSTDGWITVTRSANGELNVDIRSGILRQLTDREIAAEIRSALLAAVADHRRQYVQLRIDYFGSPVGATRFATTDTTGQL